MPDAPLTRKMQQSDWDLIYRCMEQGMTREGVVAAFNVKPATLWANLVKNRPKLAKKTKMLPTRKRVEVNHENTLVQVVSHRGKLLTDHLTKVVLHDASVLAAKVDRQEVAAERDPNYELTPVGLKVSKELLNEVKIASMIPGFGVDNGSAKGGAQVSVTVNHATAMRIGGKGIFAEEIPAAALVEPPELMDVTEIEPE